MRAAKKTNENRKVLQELIPLNALSSERFDALVGKIIIEEVRSGRYLFRKGDRDNQTIYLLAGKINLMDGFRKVSGEVEAGTDASRHPIASQQPRPLSAKVVSKAVIARIDSSLLDAFLSWDQTSAAEAIDIGAEEDGDWMTRLLQSEAFRKLPPSKLQGLLMKMKPFSVKKGDVVISQGGEGDYFYTIHEGRCAITRQDEAGAEPQLLAELGDGDSFGEDALISNSCRNATVTMLTDGELMRLAKQDFIDLLKTQLVSHVTFEQAQQLTNDGAVWIDVRSRDEYEHSAIPDSVNIPLVSLRDEMHELVLNTRYIICCDTGHRSDSAAFLLGHRGLDVCVLEGGVQNLLLAEAAPGADSSAPAQTAEIVDLSMVAGDVDTPAQESVKAAADEQLARQQADYDALRSRHEALLAELEQRHAAEARLEEQLEQLKGELGLSAAKLDEFHAQANMHADEKQSLLEQYTRQQQEHADALQSMQHALDKERSKTQELEGRVVATSGECAVLNEKVAAGEQDAQSELARLQAELAQAQGRVSELESAVESSNAASAELRKQSDEHAEQSRNGLLLLQDQLAAERNKAERLSTDLAAVTGERQNLVNEVANLGREMAVLQEAAKATSGKLEEEGGAAAALRAQNDELSRQVVQLQTDLAERQSQLDSNTANHESSIQELQQQLADREQIHNELQSLQDELDAVRSDAERASTELATVTDERQSLVKEVESLGREMMLLQEAAKATSGKLAEEGGVAAALRAQNDELIQQAGQLQAELAERQSQLDSSAVEHESRQQALQQQLKQLQDELTKRQSQLDSSAAEHEDRQQELQQQLEQLQDELAERQSQLENSATEHEDRQQELQQQLEQSQDELAERQSQLENSAAEHEDRQQEFQQQLEQLRDELTERQSRLDSSAAEHEDRQQELQQQLEQLEAELAERQSQLDSSAAEHEDRQQELQQQLDARMAELQLVQERLQSVTEEHKQAQETIEALRTEGKQLRGDISDLDNKYQAQLERAESLLAERNAAAAVYAKQQAEWHDHRAGLQQQVSMHEEAVGKLSGELEQLTASAAEASENFEQQLQQQVEEAGAELEQLTQRFVELEQAATATSSELDALTQQHAELEQQAEQSAHDKARLQEEIADKNAQMEASRLELSQYEVDKTVLGQELELSQQQIQELQQTLEQHEVQAKSVEQDLQESVRKAHDDLKRKNENEKELQGQIKEQRKKLEQVTADYQKSRGEAQDTIDYLREELHTERDARDVERVEMATRQRELKERLAAASSAPDGNTGDRSGAMEEAIDAVRIEERNRLQGVIEAHAATEEQLARVQAELKQAHAELTEHHREEKNRRQSDSELMADQNRQAEAAITQLQTQLQQLTDERDGALQDQQELRDKMDSLRAEVEVARGLMNGSGQGQAEDPVKLRKQLDDTRRNVEIAVRLRTEAEAARDRLLEERDRLLVQVEDSQSVDVPASNAEQPQAAAATSAGKIAPQQATDNDSRLPRWLVPAIGLVAVAVIAVVGWLLMTVEPKLEETASLAVEETQTAAEAETVTPATVAPSVAETAQTQPEELEQPAPIVRDKATGTSKQPAADKKVEVTRVPAQEKKAAAPAQQPVPAETSPVVRTFKDRLKIGGKGPSMVALAEASYRMGSAGNSMNSAEVPRHEVKLPAFSISRYEVSFDEYGRYAQATGKRTPKDQGWGRGKQPVINVSWSDAQGYVKWLSAQTGKTYRLPTEAQWEYAARGGNEESYWWLGVHNNIPANCFNCGSDWDGARTAPTGQFAANAFGLHDMAGNVQEWTEDCYNKNYTGAPDDGSAWLTTGCTERVVRGGSYSSPKDSLRSAKRARMEQDSRLDNLGFRVVRVD
jgi:formylglycine-generating enzyme required for sulfatase activity/chromosome segregation ATPase/CRP-like cAMP-binding protein